MDFASAGAAYHADDLARSCPANQGVIHQDHALALEQVPHRIELQLDAKVSNRLRRLSINVRPT